MISPFSTATSADIVFDAQPQTRRQPGRDITSEVRAAEEHQSWLMLLNQRG